MPALDDHVRDSLNRLLDSIRGHLESELSSCQEDLVRAANEAGIRIAAEAAESAAAEARREGEQQLAEVREAAAREAEERRTTATAEIAELQRSLGEVREDGQRQIDSAQQEIEAAQREIEAAQGQAEASQRELEASQRKLEASQRALEVSQGELDASQRELEASHREAEASQREVEVIKRERDEMSEAVGRADERFAQAARLPDAIRLLDEAATLGDVLDGLARNAGREAGRAAVFVVRGERLREWRAVGFDAESGAVGLDVSLDESGPMAEVVSSGRGVDRCDEASESQLPFTSGNGPRRAGVWPVAVGGSVVAVLYADSQIADNSNESHWPAILDVLARHAGRVLEAITVRQAAGLMTSRPVTSGSQPKSVGGHQPAGSLQ